MKALTANRLTDGEVVLGFAVTGIWIAVFTVLYRLGWRFGLRRYQAVGG